MTMFVDLCVKNEMTFNTQITESQFVGRSVAAASRHDLHKWQKTNSTAFAWHESVCDRKTASTYGLFSRLNRDSKYKIGFDS